MAMKATWVAPTVGSINLDAKEGDKVITPGEVVEFVEGCFLACLS